MNNSIVDISFYQQPKLSTNPKHKIDVLNENDKYNPFGNSNLYAKCSISFKDLYDILSQDMIAIDLNDDITDLKIYSSVFSSKLLNTIEQNMNSHSIPFLYKKSQYCTKSIFAKIDVLYDNYNIKLFIQLIGYLVNETIRMTAAYVMQLRVNDIYVVNPRFKVNYNHETIS